MLDKTTFEETVAYVGIREDGPLFLSPDGTGLDAGNNLRDWREAVTLAFVDLEWPEGEPRDLMLEFFVSKALTTKRVRVHRGGPKSGKNAPGPEKLAKRKLRIGVVRRIADGIRDSVFERMRGVDRHCLRKTHRTWALMSGAPEILIDRQLGRTSPGGEAALKAVWSLVGRAHYTDMKMLDRAEAELQEIAARGETALVARPSGDRRAATGV